MTAPPPWHDVMAALTGRGWKARVVAAEHLADAAARVDSALESGALDAGAAARVRSDYEAQLPGELGEARSVVIAAAARPLTQATLTLDGQRHTVAVPPHYAGYFAAAHQLTAAVATALAPAGHGAAKIAPPLKTLAAGSGLARYGRNNIAYVAGFGSYLVLAACASDAPPPPDAAWGEPHLLERCERCSACLRACPTGAIHADRFLLQADRCLTWVNEDEAPFPAWVDPAWHTCAVGCLRCQQVCPEDAVVDLRVTPPEVFDEAESRLILAAADAAALAAATREKLARCGLDYSAALVARNIRALIGL